MTVATGPAWVVLVEGDSDAAVVRVLLAAAGRGHAEVVAMQGITNLPRHLAEYDDAEHEVRGLSDAGEERVVQSALRGRGRHATSREELGWHGFFVCDRDLEDELIRGLGVEVVQDVVDELGELHRFRRFQQMPAWRDRPVAEQLHRFAGSGSGRKRRLAQALAERLDPDHLPAPLEALVLSVEPSPGG